MELYIYGNRISFDDDLKIFFNKLCQYNKKRDEITDKAINHIELGNIKEALDLIDREYKSIVKEIISEISVYGIYDRTIDDFVNSNSGYVDLLNTYTEYLQHVKNISKRFNAEAQMDVERAANRAQSQIKGLDFGIITNDILSHMIYNSMNNSEIRNSTKKATEQFEIEAHNILDWAKIKTDNETSKYKADVFIPNVKEAISKMISTLIAQYIVILSECNKFDMSSLDGIDENRSNSILVNLSLVDDKEKLMLKAIELCPYNLNIYVLAHENNCFDMGMAQLVKYFNLEEVFINSILNNKNFLPNRVEDIECVYKKLHSEFQSISYVKETSSEEVFGDFIRPTLDDKLNRLGKILDLSKKCNYNKRLAFVKNNFVIDDDNNYKLNVLTLINSIFTKDEVKCLMENAHIDIIGQVSSLIETALILSSYEQLCEYLLTAFSECEEDYKDYLDKTELEKRIKKEKEELELEEHIKKIKIKRKKIFVSIFTITIVIVSYLVLYFNIILPNKNFNEAVDLINNENYKEAGELLIKSNKDDEEIINLCIGLINDLEIAGAETIIIECLGKESLLDKNIQEAFLQCGLNAIDEENVRLLTECIDLLDDNYLIELTTYAISSVDEYITNNEFYNAYQLIDVFRLDDYKQHIEYKAIKNLSGDVFKINDYFDIITRVDVYNSLPVEYKERVDEMKSGFEELQGAYAYISYDNTWADYYFVSGFNIYSYSYYDGPDDGVLVWCRKEYVAYHFESSSIGSFDGSMLMKKINDNQIEYDKTYDKVDISQLPKEFVEYIEAQEN